MDYRRSTPNFKLHTGASGGAKLGRTREFLKEPDTFREDKGPGARQDYAGPSTGAKRTGNKSLPAIKPRS